MKRTIVLATAAAALLLGGGAYTAVAVTSDDGRPESSRPSADTRSGEADDRHGGDADDRAEREALRGAAVDVREAVGAALAAHPGAAVASVEFEERDEDGPAHWEVELWDAGGRELEVTVDARSAETASRTGD
ncbi:MULTISPECIES: PepSY domain-containing protein [unclassified Streptomyces]|uniref:PepSY domain-containing protein n=1 Tax=unclassified Streptomyces TaxID=2593676 RepID=UPI00341C05DD